jgi:hypothetical protein
MTPRFWLGVLVIVVAGAAWMLASRIESFRVTSVPSDAAMRSAARTASSDATSRAAGLEQGLAASCRRSLDALRRKAGANLTYKLDVPFLLAGDLSEAELNRITDQTIRPAAEALWRQYFQARPTEPITILLFAGEPSYERYARKLFGDTKIPHFGYYRPGDRTLVMNLATGTGTLVHELVHALAAFDFPKMPDWFSEGLASLYEQCALAGGEIRGLPNWRLPDLQEALRAGTVRPLKEMMTAADFRGPLEGLNYAQGRYFCLYMQERGVLGMFYRRFRDGVAEDPTGVRFVEEVFRGEPLDRLDRDYARWVLTLRWP